jgi:hypothetical protein
MFKVMQYISYFILLSGLFISSFVYSQPSVLNNKNDGNFSSPVDIPILLSGNYGEIRSTGFHAGIDIKTQQIEGKNVLAADSGYVFRISVQSGSYGKAVYLKHYNGLVTVYGHFSRFEKSLEQYVKDQQYKRKSFTVDLYPEKGMFTFRKGEQIGFSGNTGNSSGPHLHFEIRDESATIPLNVMHYGLPIADHTLPVIKTLAIYPLNNESMVNGRCQKILYKVEGRNGQLHIDPEIVDLTGKIGFGIETYDYLDQTTNDCNPYILSLYIDGTPLFKCRFDSIPFSMMGYVNSHIDYDEKMKSGKVIHKLFLDPNNQLKIYELAVNHGMLQLTDSLTHNMKVVAEDIYGNQSAMQFKIRNSGLSPESVCYVQDSLQVAHFKYNTINMYENKDVRVYIPNDALFDDIDFQFRRIDGRNVSEPEIYQIHNKYTPLFKSYILSLNPVHIPKHLIAKAIIATEGENGTWTSQGGDYGNGFITTQVKEFGRFFITVDTINPVIRPESFKTGGRYNEGQVLSFLITDKQSGIRSYNGYIDKKWALFEYDGKNNSLFYTVDGSKQEKNKLHSLEIIVIDNKDNTSHFTGNFYF